MSSKCFTIRKHFYTTNSTTRDAYTNVGSGTGNACISGPNAFNGGYFYDDVEGYVFSPNAAQPTGTVALRIGYRGTSPSDVNSGWAMYTDADTRFAAYKLSRSR